MVVEMREPTVLVLTALAGGRKHGYAVTVEVAAMSEGRVRLRPGTLYAALDRLSEEGLVRPSGEEVVDGRRRRYYELTEGGAAALGGQAARMRENAERATRRLAVWTVTA